MKKVILDLSLPGNIKEVHEYIAEEMEFPAYYGNNLDALYDMLTAVGTPTAVGIFMPVPDGFDGIDFDYYMFLEKLKQVFKDAEAENDDLAVIFGDIVDNFEEDGSEEDDFDIDEIIGHGKASDSYTGDGTGSGKESSSGPDISKWVF